MYICIIIYVYTYMSLFCNNYNCVHVFINIMQLAMTLDIHVHVHVYLSYNYIIFILIVSRSLEWYTLVFVNQRAEQEVCHDEEKRLFDIGYIIPYSTYVHVYFEGLKFHEFCKFRSVGEIFQQNF